MKPYMRRAQARYFYRQKPTPWLFHKRTLSLATLLGLEDVLAERGEAALPGRIRGILGMLLNTRTREESG